MSGGGTMGRNWTVGESILSPNIDAGTQTIGDRTVASAVRDAETVTLPVYQLGRVIFTANSTEVLLANNEIVHHDTA